MDDLLKARFQRMTVAYKRLLDAYTYGNRRDRAKLMHEAELIIADAVWGCSPPMKESE